MSELKVASCFEFEKVLSGKSNKLFYAKSEVDKVIENKNAKILALDAEVFKQKHHARLFFDERNYAETQLRKQKYKRCLAMARWCSAELGMLVSTWESKIKYYKRWRKHWLELAEKFKSINHPVG